MLAVHDDSMMTRPLTVRFRSCTAQASSHACRACTSALGRATVDAAARSWALRGRGTVVFALPRSPSVGLEKAAQAARGRLRDHRDGAHGSSGAVGARQACWPDPSRLWMAAARVDGAVGALANVSIEIVMYSIHLSIAILACLV